MESVIAKIQAARAKTKASLSGVELMQYNLNGKLRAWIMRKTEKECVSICEIVDKINAYAPKAILKSRKQFELAVNNLWSVAHDYSIYSEDFLREDLEYELDRIF